MRQTTLSYLGDLVREPWITPALPGLSPVGGKPVVARFDGGHLSFDGRLLVLREVERRRCVST